LTELTKLESLTELTKLSRVSERPAAVDEEILHEGPMPGAVIYISKFQNKLAWKFGISVSLQKQVLCPRTFILHHQTARICADSSTGVYPFLNRS
jgi:hypothetical protein